MRRRLYPAGLSALLAVFVVAPARAGPLALERFFQGQLVATGVIDNLRDGSHRPFTIAMAASWSGPTGTLVEDVAYADGEKEHKVWTFTKVGDGSYVGRREDLTRDAEVIEDAQGVRMSYKAKVRLPLATLNLGFEDRLTLTSPDTISATSDVSYLFVSAARLTMTIKRLKSR